MYNVAIIQNDSEMMRYSWADIRPMVKQLGYTYHSFTANDISNLYININSFDAIIIATNACSDTKIKESLDANSNEINSFLKKGKGLAVLFQMKKDDNEFFNYLPEELRINTINRVEDLKSGDLNLNESYPFHPIICYPNNIDITKIKEHCLNNKHVNGLYWTFLEPVCSENYNVIIEDNSFEDEKRSLIISTREDFEYRIVVSSIALDWQGHEKLWENTIKYAVEGKTNIGLITKLKTSSYDFRYFVSWLKANKIPAKEYKNDTIITAEIEFNTHSIYIIDPVFSEIEIRKFISVASPFINSGKAEIIFFNKSKFSKPYIALISDVSHFQTISLNAITWIKSQFPSDHGYFARSFWNTLDVITTLKEFGVSTDQYKDKILTEIAKHDRGGNYDEVLGATCAMFEIYDFYLGAEHEKTLTALQWILENYKNKVLFERASAIEVLLRFNCEIASDELERFKVDVRNFFEPDNSSIRDNEFQLYRFCQTLFLCGFIEDAKRIAFKFSQTQDYLIGKWSNVSHTAAIVELLIKIRERIEDSDKKQIEEIIFKGIEYLYDNYNAEQFSWNNEVLATAKSLRALKLFEERVLFPVDVIKNRIIQETKRISNFSAISIATDINAKYIKDIEHLQNKIKIHESEFHNIMRERKKYKKFSRYFFLFIVLFLLFFIISIIIVQTNSIWKEVSNYYLLFFQENFVKILIGSVPIIIWISIIILNEYDLIPDKTPNWIKKIISRIVPEPGFNIIEQNKDDIQNL